MAEIGITAVGVNHYAPSSCNLVRMYTTNGSEELLSLGQLVSAVMLRAAAAYEARAVYSINMLNSNTSYQSMLAYAGKRICDSAELFVDAKGDKKFDLKTVSLAAQVKEFGYHPKSPEFAASGTMWDFLVYDCKIPADLLQKKNPLRDFQACIDVYEQVRPVLEDATRASAMTEVSMQSAVSRRDVSFTTAANIVKVTTGTAAFAAASLRG